MGDEVIQDAPAELPEGDYAVVEVMGHRTMIGRVSEVEKFGAKFMALEPVLNGVLLPPVLIGGTSIYAITPTDAAGALRNQPTRDWQLPESLRLALPPQALPAQPVVEHAPRAAGLYDDLNSGEDIYRELRDDNEGPPF